MTGQIDYSIKLNLFAIGMKARIGKMEARDVARLQEQVKAMPAHECKDAINDILADLLKTKRSPDELAEVGAAICGWIDRWNRPEPVDAGRKDIYG
ncbi:MAG: hypothetical protein AAF408_00815 [Pseudomonadota bacterium]